MSDCLLVLFLEGGSNDLNPETPSPAAEHLYEMSSRLPYEKLVLYPDEINSRDVFSDGGYAKEIQSGGDTGNRLKDAVRIGFERGYKRVVVLREGFADMGQGHITEAFESLLNASVTVGPGENGSYYLIGMNKFYPVLFEGKDWSGEDVFLDTLIDLRSCNIPFVLLDTLAYEDSTASSGRMSKSQL
jgi:uncharacterized protein